MVKVVIITGLSGSGKSTAKKCFEDMGYYTIDNLPLPLVSEFLRLIIHTHEGIQNIAMVMDARSGDFINLLPGTIGSLKQRNFQVELIFLDASDEVLKRRYSETRRKHPLSPDDSPKAGIARERSILKDIREKSDLIINTSDYNAHQFKHYLQQRYLGKAAQRSMALRITSFGYRYGLPQDADLVFDVRFLPNPFFNDELRDLTGIDKKVREFVLSSKAGDEFQQKLVTMIDYLIPHYLEEGKAYLHIALGCTGGKHRSVAMAHTLAEHLRQQGQNVQTEDRDIKLS